MVVFIKNAAFWGMALIRDRYFLEDDAYSCPSVKKSLTRDRRLFETRR